MPVQEFCSIKKGLCVGKTNTPMADYSRVQIASCTKMSFSVHCFLLVSDSK